MKCSSPSARWRASLASPPRNGEGPLAQRGLRDPLAELTHAPSCRRLADLALPERCREVCHPRLRCAPSRSLN